ncbi:MAG: MotA/TolQ/ExbB proton channel family protein [Bacteroidetes bacterium]|jgi:biopolymer transport protein ExbB|nr:MotA/TolQ/ExbB proton channel family protein [Bacteroidota bacterium]MBU1578785.1 MotA/TolQ/ExbB proton channel family protein [Bacteroidota bacterium]MBU2466159.1 MotA/TolQ/ExbB proton channel family protein [Bacteroidota bacterium]MBU2557862.1 MotA/TolQ/ExbB proton channel family protein [Bacteroidota bacterium]MDA3944217.1 MotA/TolQ/ExbB proton channel family protein [Bacteroidota bacterium]
MKKIIALLTIAGVMTFGISNIMFAQDTQPDTTAADTTTVAVEPVEVETVEMEAEPAKPQTFHEVLKEQFIQGGPEFMGIVLLTLIFGLAISIERIIYLTLSTTNTKKLLGNIESALNSDGLEKAKEICRDTRGPVASIFYQGLLRYDSGIDEVEKSIVSYGSVITGRLESGVSWISLFIALAPMLGFMGTVIGMIKAFDDIAAAGDISPQIVASGIKVALLTTVFGLIVAIILQIFYNYIVSKIDNLVNDMEDSSISFIDIVNKYAKK